MLTALHRLYVNTYVDVQEPISVTGRLQSIIMNRGAVRGMQHRTDSSRGPSQNGRRTMAGLREESQHFFGPNSSDNTLPVLIDMGFHKYAVLSYTDVHNAHG